MKKVEAQWNHIVFSSSYVLEEIRPTAQQEVFIAIMFVFSRYAIWLEFSDVVYAHQLHSLCLLQIKWAYIDILQLDVIVNIPFFVYSF